MCELKLTLSNAQYSHISHHITKLILLEPLNISSMGAVCVFIDINYFALLIVASITVGILSYCMIFSTLIVLS